MKVLSRSARMPAALLAVGPIMVACALGRTGVRARKREGDGATPRGRFAIAAIYWRPDRVRRPYARVPVLPIRRDLGWCDDARDRNYNRPVKLPYPASAERMWREDHLYDIVVVLDYNLRRRTRGLGSAIFMHVARKDLTPTEGCIALPLQKLGRVLALTAAGAVLDVGMRPEKKGSRNCFRLQVRARRRMV